MTALIVTTSVAEMADGRPTGAYASELATTWQSLTDLGYDITIASVVGGPVPIEGRHDADPAQSAFFAGRAAPQVANSESINQVGDDFDVVCIIGGHGAVLDLPGDADLRRLIVLVYARHRVVAAVCHGVAGLLGRDGAGQYFLSGRRVAAFSDDEEHAVGMNERVPFLLSEALAAAGAEHDVAPPFLPHVVVDERLVTGQNPASAGAVAVTAGRLAADPKLGALSGTIQDEPEALQEDRRYVDPPDIS